MPHLLCCKYRIPSSHTQEKYAPGEFNICASYLKHFEQSILGAVE